MSYSRYQVIELVKGACFGHILQLVYIIRQQMQC